MTRLRSGVVHRSATDSTGAGSADVVGSSSGGHMISSVRYVYTYIYVYYSVYKA